MAALLKTSGEIGPAAMLNRDFLPVNWTLKAYLFLLMLLLPVDWFGPTGKLLREGGARPAIPLLLVGTALIAATSSSPMLKMSRTSFGVALLLFTVFGLGVGAFFLNSLLSWSGAGFQKDPFAQFLAQALLFALFCAVVIIHGELFRRAAVRKWIFSCIPAVVFLHLVVIGLEYARVLTPGSGWLSLFRTTDEIDRPSGLMSEPSYFGAFAGLYGTALLAIRPVPRYAWRAMLGIALFATAVLIRAKTFVPVALCDFLILVWRNPRAVFRLRYMPVMIVAATVSLYVIIANAALDMRDNLSSIMRFGSAHLALNAALRGYGLTGIGFGQFHFFFKPEFAPSYLFLSEEAASQFSPSADFRASTFNLFARLLLETGIIGLSIFIYVLYRVMKPCIRDLRPETTLGLFITAGSLGFLMTQDPYFYPPLAVGIAILLGCAPESHRFLGGHKDAYVKDLTGNDDTI